MATSHLFHVSFIAVLCWNVAASFPFPPQPEPELPSIFPSEPTNTPIESPLRNDSFHLSMNENIPLDPNSETQLKVFKLPQDGETKGLEPGHYLGNVKDLDPINGRFTAKEGGVFLITASIQLSTSTASSVPTTKTPEPEAGTERRRRESASQLQEVSVAVCIDASSDNCNEALITTGVLTGSLTTLAVVGNLQLKIDQKVTVRISNKSEYPMTILKRSSLSVHKL